MMNTPICDFVKAYSQSNAIRLHMPGHKGANYIGCENIDITEIKGADSLYEASGIIKESENNASSLFESNTFYSTEGSSLSIRAMLYLYKLWAGNDAKIIAGRNAHKAFLSAVSLLDLDVEWLYPKNGSFLSNQSDVEILDHMLAGTNKTAVYITSPDYLGNISDISRISDICKKHNAKLLVDNAHGAYLKFLPNSLHPIDLGADICCDSAHKTLPVLTGGAYLHISKSNDFFAEHAKDALSIFGSTSPSYLILQSLDKANKYIYDGYKSRLADCIDTIRNTTKKLNALGYDIYNNEPLKILIKPQNYGYYGYEIAKYLESKNIFAEFYDKEHIVFMITPDNSHWADILYNALKALDKRTPINDVCPEFSILKKGLSPRQTIFAQSEIINVSDSFGRIFAGFNISCPPAVPIVVCGEIIDKNAITRFEYYGIDKCRVVK